MTSTSTSTSTSTGTTTTHYGSAVVTLPSDTEIKIHRVFDAPATLVFDVWTTPQHVRRWWGSIDAPLTECTIDLRVGGNWRYVTRTQGGVELGWHGTYEEILVPGRLVSTEVFEGFPDAESLNTLTLVERDGQTMLEVLVRHRTKENRDGHVNSGMEAGMQKCMNEVDDILAELITSVATRTVADRYRNVAERFTQRIREVSEADWERPAPCEGWVTRDVVRHLVEWVPALLLTGADVTIPAGPSVDADPVGAWLTLSDAIQTVLDDPTTATRTFNHPQAGIHPLDTAIGMFILGDVLIHTWDIARAAGLDESLDETEVEGMYFGMLPLDEMLRSSGHYGPRVHVADHADTQTKLIAFTGRLP
jgi:uncharacterized protein (TIGR03086 family)